VDIAARGVNGLLMIALPLVLGAYLVRRFRLAWSVFGAGALTFVASQVVHLPFNAWVLNPFLMTSGLVTDSGAFGRMVVAALLGLSAGVCEEGARFLAYRFALRRARTWPEGILFGAGHGGMEAALLGGLALYGLAQAIAYRDLDLAAILPPDQVATVQSQLAAYWADPWYVAMLGALERAGALCIQIALAVLVLQVFVRRQAGWIAVAVGWHALVDAIAVLALQAWGVLATEGLVVLMAVASLAMVHALRPTPLAAVPAGPSRLPPPDSPLTMAGEVPSEDADLDASRYVD
jgi:uncharacterized membrane protein YhfC